MTETLNYSFDIDDHYVLDDALRNYRMSVSGWGKEQKDRVARISKWVSEGISRLEKPARDEQILKQAAAILRERGIKSWSP